MGNVPTTHVQPTSLTCCCTTVLEPVESLMRKFWELEEVPGTPTERPEDLECEEFYRATTRETLLLADIRLHYHFMEMFIR